MSAHRRRVECALTPIGAHAHTGARTHQHVVSGGSEVGQRSQAGPLANGSLASQGRQMSLEPVEEDQESGYGETQVCWHEVHAMSLLDPVLDKQVRMRVWLFLLS